MLNRDLSFLHFPSSLTRGSGWDWDAENHFLQSDIYETKDQYVLEIDLPGIKPDQVDLSVQESGLLQVNVKAVEEKNEKGKQNAEGNGSYVYKERRAVSGSRSFQLSNDIDKDNINAKLDNGVLRVVLQKKMKAAPKKIQLS